MKIIYVCLLLMFAGIGIGFAQIQKGTKYLGVELSASGRSQKSTDLPDRTQRDVSFSVTPSYSYFISRGWELRGGLGLGVGNQRTKGNPVLKESSSYLLAPSVGIRKHLMLSEKLGFATGPYALYALNKINYKQEDDIQFEQYSAGINLQVEYFPMKNFGVSANLLDVSYSKMNIKEAGRSYSKTSYFNAGLTNQVSLRFFYMFGKGLGK